MRSDEGWNGYRDGTGNGAITPKQTVPPATKVTNAKEFVAVTGRVAGWRAPSVVADDNCRCSRARHNKYGSRLYTTHRELRSLWVHSPSCRICCGARGCIVSNRLPQQLSLAAAIVQSKIVYWMATYCLLHNPNSPTIFFLIYHPNLCFFCSLSPYCCYFFFAIYYNALPTTLVIPPNLFECFLKTHIPHV